MTSHFVSLLISFEAVRGLRKATLTYSLGPRPEAAEDDEEDEDDEEEEDGQDDEEGPQQGGVVASGAGPDIRWRRERKTQ